MNKKIILGITTGMFLASSLFASNGQDDMKKGYKQKSCHHKVMKKNSHQMKDNKVIDMVMKLDLKDEQRVKIRTIMKDGMAKVASPLSAFTENGFDKMKFIKLIKEKKENKVERYADTISKVYAVLNVEQKKDLKTIIDMKEIKHKKMMNMKGNFNGKKCEGRK